MNEVIELCEWTSSCMLSPNQCEAGWFLIAFGFVAMIFAWLGWSYKSTPSLSVWKKLLQPLCFQGRESLTDFRSTYFGIGVFLLIWGEIFFFLVGLSTAIWQKALAWIGVIGVVWASLVVFASWVRRCHDLGYFAKEAIFRRNFLDLFVMFRWHREGFGCSMRWQVFHDTGDPSPNQFGPAPEENIPRILKKEEIEFPEVWSDDAFKK